MFQILLNYFLPPPSYSVGAFYHRHLWYDRKRRCTGMFRCWQRLYRNDWFRLRTLDDSLQLTIDILLNLSIFMWFGAVCLWQSFLNNDVVLIYRLIFLAVLIPLFRRLPVVFAIHSISTRLSRRDKQCSLGSLGVRESVQSSIRISV